MHIQSLQSVYQVNDINIVDSAVLPAPEVLCREVCRDDAQAEFVVKARQTIHDIIFADDKRLLLIVGPCSIHDVRSGRDYAERLATLAREVSDRIYVVMRVYFEKPRTTVGWKGLILDPHLDGTCNIPAGLQIARTFLRDVINLGLPTATELLDPITPQYIADLVCWSAIGARTTESQTHRQMASGLSMPLGFKNATSGSLRVALNAIRAACQPQTFLGISRQGLASAITTRGNPSCHIILRGGDNGPNFSRDHIVQTRESLLENKLIPAVMVDCSHGNSSKDHARQKEVLQDVVHTLLHGEHAVIGAMIESNLVAGAQAILPREQLEYGKSITDACIGWEETEELVRSCYELLGPRFSSAQA